MTKSRFVPLLALTAAVFISGCVTSIRTRQSSGSSYQTGPAGALQPIPADRMLNAPAFDGGPSGGGSIIEEPPFAPPPSPAPSETTKQGSSIKTRSLAALQSAEQKFKNLFD